MQPTQSPSDTDKYGARHAIVISKKHDRYRVVWELLHFPINLACVLVRRICGRS